MTARSYGFCGEMSGANTAISTMIVSSTSPNTAMGLAMKSASARRRGVSARRGSVATGTSTGRLLIALALRLGEPDARIERRVQQVDEQVDRNEERHDDKQVRHDHGPVQQVDGIDQQLAHARPREHALGDDRKADQRAELQTDDRDDRDQD